MSKNYVKEYNGYKVPEGATHYNESINCFYGEFDGVCLIRHANRKYSEEGWSAITHQHMQEAAIELPEEPVQEWVDEQPPVGCECEIKYFHDDESKWAKCYVVGETKDNKCLVINVYHDDSLHFAFKKKGSLEFRPLKTQEQKDREALFEIMQGLQPVSTPAVNDVLDHYANNLIDAGFKAPEGE